MLRSTVAISLALALLYCGAPAADPKPAAAPVITVPVASADQPPPPPAPAPAREPEPPPPVARVALRIDRTIPTGEWPEGVAVVGDVAWVAESGSRRIERVALDRDAPSATVAVGRLPTDIAAGANGKLYTLAHTDRALWEIDPKTMKGRVIDTLPDCPEAMALGDGAVWALLWKDCGSGSSSVVRVDLTSRKQTRSPEIGRNAWSIAYAAQKAWVATSDTLASIDGATLRGIRTFEPSPQPTVARKIVSGPHGVYVNAEGGVLRVDPARGEVIERGRVPEEIGALYADAELVLAASQRGAMWMLDPMTLEITKELAAPSPGFNAHAIARYKDRFVVTDHGSDRAHGRLLVLSITSPAPAP